MRFLLAVCCIFGIFLSNCLNGAIPKPSEVPNVLEYVMNCFAEEQKAKHLVMVEKFVEYDDCRQINRVGFLFDLYDTISMDASRVLVTGLVNDLFKSVTGNPKLKPYLVSPFTEKEVIIRLRMRTKQCGFIYPVLGNIAYVSVIDGIVIYDTINSYTYDLDTLRTESFQEALKIAERSMHSLTQ